MKTLVNTFFTIDILLSIYYLYLHIIPLDINKLLLGVVSIIILMIPIALEKLKKIKIEKYIKLIYYFFLLVAFILGGLFGLFYSTSFFDLLVHAIFGIVLSIILTARFKIKSLKKFLLILSIVISISFLWETLEFSSDILFNTDHQEKINGANDTMTDIIVSIIGSAIYIIYSFLVNKFASKKT
jgi:hypothetical protein